MPAKDLTNHSIVGSFHFKITTKKATLIIVGSAFVFFYWVNAVLSTSAVTTTPPYPNTKISSIERPVSKLATTNSNDNNNQFSSSLSLRPLDHVSRTGEPEPIWFAENHYASIKTYFSHIGPSIFPNRTNDFQQFNILPSQIVVGNETPFPTTLSHETPKVDGNKIVYKRPYGTEWYINESRGLEHGLTINDSDFYRGQSTLSALVNFKGLHTDYSALQNAQSVNLKLNNILVSYSQLQVIDADGKHLPSSFHLPQKPEIQRIDQDGLQLAIVVDISEARFPIAIDPLIQSTTAEFFGINGINVTLGYNIVNVGDVTGNGFDDVLVTDPFGESQLSDVQSVNRGAVNLYEGSANGIGATPIWTYSEPQLDSSGTVGSHFGYWAAAAGDINQDGFNDFIVSAPQYSSPPSNTTDYIGRVYVFLGAQGGVYSKFYVNEFNKTQLTRYGNSVAGADVNGDGRNDLIIGHPEYNNPQANGTFHGRVLVFHASSSTNFVLSDPTTWFSATPDWSQTLTNNGARFGMSVANAGDVNNDGFGDVLIGASGYSNGQSVEGAAYIYYGSANGLTSANNWQIEGNQAGAELGLYVYGVGDVNGDNIDDVIVSAPFWSSSLTNAGKLSLYLGQSISGPSTTPAWTYYGDAKGANVNVASRAGDINGDGYGDVIVAVPNYATSTATGTFGRVLVFTGNATGLDATSVFDKLGLDAQGQLGFSASGGGDVNGDGYPDILIGEPGKTATGTFYVEYVKATSDLEVTVVDSVDPVPPNSNYNYTIGVINHGPDAARSVVVVNILPAGSIYQGVSASPNWVCNEVSLVITCSLDALVASVVPDTITVSTRYPTPTSVIVNNVSISANVVDSIAVNNSASESTRINASPVANNLIISTNEDVKYIASRSQDFLPGSDPDGDSITFSLVSPGAAHGTAVVETNGAFSYQPALNYFGSDSFQYMVDDGLAKVSATVNITVNPVNDAPIPQDITKTIGESFIYTDTLTAIDVDTPIAQLIFSVQQAPQHGNLQFSSNGNFTYTPTANYVGSDNFIFSVSDNGTPNLSSSGMVSITIISINDPPIVSNQTFTTNEDTTLSDILIASDSQTPTAQLLFQLTGGLPTSKGTLILSPDGNFTYTPNSNISGVDHFEFEVFDNSNPQKSSVATAMINIASVNDKPTAFNQDLLVIENTKATGSLLASDVENDVLTFSLVNGPSKGDILLTAESGRYEYTPKAGATGADSFIFKVFDGMDYSDIATVSVDIRTSGGGNITPSNPKLVSPAQDDIVDPSNAEFKWQPSSDPDSVNLTYKIAVCLDDPTVNCSSTTVITTASLGHVNNFSITDSGIGLFFYVLGAVRRRKYWLKLIWLTAIVATLFSCSDGAQDVATEKNKVVPPVVSELLSYKLTNLNPGSTYYWKVIVSDNSNGVAESEIRRFTTQN